MVTAITIALVRLPCSKEGEPLFPGLQLLLPACELRWWESLAFGPPSLGVYAGATVVHRDRSFLLSEAVS